MSSNEDLNLPTLSFIYRDGLNVDTTPAKSIYSVWRAQASGDTLCGALQPDVRPRWLVEVTTHGLLVHEDKGKSKR